MSPARHHGSKASGDTATRVGVSRTDSNRGGLSVRTLAIASAASALATFLVPMIWAPGTIAAAAATPVIVALISEALSRPVEHVSHAGRLVRAPRRRFAGRLDPVARRRMRLAVVTGLLAFLVAAVIITTTELATGEAVSGGGQRTTLLGGESERSGEQADPANIPAPAAEAPATPVPEGTVTPDAEATPDPAAPGAPAATPVAPNPEATTTPPPVTPNATPAPVVP